MCVPLPKNPYFKKTIQLLQAYLVCIDQTEQTFNKRMSEWEQYWLYINNLLHFTFSWNKIFESIFRWITFFLPFWRNYFSLFTDPYTFLFDNFGENMYSTFLGNHIPFYTKNINTESEHLNMHRGSYLLWSPPRCWPGTCWYWNHFRFRLRCPLAWLRSWCPRPRRRWQSSPF